MKIKNIFIRIIISVLIPLFAYAGDTPVLATSMYVQDMYNQLITQISNKQEVLPMATRPSSGKYKLLWDGDMGQFIFEKEKSGLQCDTGTYDIGLEICVNASLNGTSSGFDKSGWTWWTDFTYGRIRGEATCLSAAEGLGRTDGRGSYYGTGNYSRTYIDAIAGLKNYDANGGARRYCWCKMTYPATSRWVFRMDNESVSGCADGCANGCSVNIRAWTDIRAGLFESVD